MANELSIEGHFHLEDDLDRFVLAFNDRPDSVELISFEWKLSRLLGFVKVVKEENGRFHRIIKGPTNKKYRITVEEIE